MTPKSPPHVSRSASSAQTGEASPPGLLVSPNDFDIRHERTPPYTPKYNGVVEGTLDLQRKKAFALPRGVIEGKTYRLWTEVMTYACHMSKRCLTTSVDQGTIWYKLRYDRLPSFDGLLLFGTVGYM